MGASLFINVVRSGESIISFEVVINVQNTWYPFGRTSFAAITHATRRTHNGASRLVMIASHVRREPGALRPGWGCEGNGLPACKIMSTLPPPPLCSPSWSGTREHRNRAKYYNRISYVSTCIENAPHRTPGLHLAVLYLFIFRFFLTARWLMSLLFLCCTCIVGEELAPRGP